MTVYSRLLFEGSYQSNSYPYYRPKVVTDFTDLQCRAVGSQDPEDARWFRFGSDVALQWNVNVVDWRFRRRAADLWQIYNVWHRVIDKTDATYSWTLMDNPLDRPKLECISRPINRLSNAACDIMYQMALPRDGTGSPGHQVNFCWPGSVSATICACCTVKLDAGNTTWQFRWYV